MKESIGEWIMEKKWEDHHLYVIFLFAPIPPLFQFDADGNLEEEGEAYYYADPKKALAKFFERVGFDMNFTYAESGAGHTHKWTCSIEYVFLKFQKQFIGYLWKWMELIVPVLPKPLLALLKRMPLFSAH